MAARNETMGKPVVALTMGDPAGVGPEICLRAVASAEVRRICTPVLIGDLSVLERVGSRLGLDCPGRVMSLEEWTAASVLRIGELTRPFVVDCGIAGPGKFKPGRISALCGAASYRYVEVGTYSALDGKVAALVTAPICKASLKLAGMPYTAHTEMLVSLAGTGRHCMIFAADGMLVALATVHVPLREVSAALTRVRVATAIELTVETLRRLGKRAPKVVVCGLNPHAGECGLMGVEDIAVIEPCVRDAKRRGWAVVGPLPADTAFLPDRMQRTDGYVAMYHDQGLIPFKMLEFDRGVNITAGLRIVRTSVDHGTAFDIAWKGKASAGSLIAAIRMAVSLQNGGSDRPRKA